MDNLDVGEANLDHKLLPRIKAYTYAQIKAIIKKDIKSRKGDHPVVYGRLLVRSKSNSSFYIC